MNWNAYLDLLLDILLDTLKVLPILYLVYLLLEWLSTRFSLRLLTAGRGRGALPLLGALCGLLPQCGFSSAAAALFNEGAIGGGTLLAVFFSTSDEAVPLLLSHPERYGSLLALLLCKLIFGALFGYLFTYTVFRRHPYGEALSGAADGHPHHDSAHTHANDHADACATGHCHGQHETEVQAHAHTEHALSHTEHALSHTEHALSHTLACELEAVRSSGHACSSAHTEAQPPEPSGCGCGCCHSRSVFLSALLHTLKIGGFVLGSLLLVQSLVFFAGDEALGKFLLSGGPFQPVLAALFGLIPGCGTSVFLTELFLSGHLSFGACLAGLSTGAGFGLLILLGSKKYRKQGVLVLLCLVCSAILLGLGTDLVLLLL